MTKKEGASRASSTSETQKEAIADANRFADGSGGGEANIHRKDNNQIRDKKTIGDVDPEKSKG